MKKSNAWHEITAIPEWMRKLDLSIRWIVWTCRSFRTLDWILSVHHHSHRNKTWNIMSSSLTCFFNYLEPSQWWGWEESLVLAHLESRWLLILEQRRRLSVWSWVSWGTNWWRYQGRHCSGSISTPEGCSARREMRRRMHWSAHPANVSDQLV